jgi:ribosome-associated protein
MRKLSDRLRVQALADADDRDLTSRSDLRRESNARELLLRKLAEDLVRLNPRQLERLALDAELLESVQHAQSLGDVKARSRQIGVVRQQLRTQADTARELRERVVALKAGALPSAPPPRDPEPVNEAVDGWVERFLSEGDTAIEEFLAEHAEADRQALRQGARALARVRDSGTSSGASNRSALRMREELQRWL